MFMTSFKNSTPWLEIASRFVSGELDQKYKMDYTDEWRIQTTIDHSFEHSKPAIKPEASKGEDWHIVSSYSHSVFNSVSDGDETPYWAAVEDGAKFKSREAIYKYYNEEFPTANVTEAQCKDINEFALDHVRKHGAWVNDTLKRYDTYG
jgi:hypothetical protein